MIELQLSKEKDERNKNEREECLIKFNEELAILVKRHGYKSYLITLEESAQDEYKQPRYSSVISTETLRISDDMRRESMKKVKDFINNAIIPNTNK